MAVVHYMFFNREDVLWFKPVELKTKGYIKEPLGIHGHTKCSFDGKLKSQDTNFPKWTCDPYGPESVFWVKSEISSAVPEAASQQDGKGCLALKILSKKGRKELNRVDQKRHANELLKRKKE
ncbi:hypothetical protein GH733_008077, partial [Mirounga leonina]